MAKLALQVRRIEVVGYFDKDTVADRLWNIGHWIVGSLVLEEGEKIPFPKHGHRNGRAAVDRS